MLHKRPKELLIFKKEMLHGICHLDNYSYSSLEILNFYSPKAQSVQRLGYGLDDPGFESRKS